MMRFLMPIILIGAAVGVFFLFSNPIYNDILQLRTQVSSYDEALNNEKSLEVERDKLTTKENAIDPTNLVKLQKLLPDSIDNIRLILEIEQIASPYGMVLKNIKYNATNTPLTQGIQGGAVVTASNKDYGVWDMEFSATTTYNNFLNFTKDIENNLRIVDISSIDFLSNSSGGLNGLNPASGSAANEAYTYDFKIKTYWLKN